MNDQQIAWFAGLFEGEGCIHIAKNGGVQLTINMTDRDVIERLNRMFPTGRKMAVQLHRKPVKPGYNTPKPLYGWEVGKPELVKGILCLILPWLGERRSARALQALEHASRPGTGGVNKSKTHCAQGHEYTPENTYIRPGTDHRHCRACMAQWVRDYEDRTNPTRAKRSPTHCPKGHPYDEKNTYIVPGRGVRNCRECRRLYKAVYDARKRLSAG